MVCCECSIIVAVLSLRHRDICSCKEIRILTSSFLTDGQNIDSDQTLALSGVVTVPWEGSQIGNVYSPRCLHWRRRGCLESAFCEDTPGRNHVHKSWVAATLRTLPCYWYTLLKHLNSGLPSSGHSQCSCHLQFSFFWSILRGSWPRYWQVCLICCGLFGQEVGFFISDCSNMTS